MRFRTRPEDGWGKKKKQQASYAGEKKKGTESRARLKTRRKDAKKS